MVRRVSEAFLVVALTANKRSTSGAKGTLEKMQIKLNNVFFKSSSPSYQPAQLDKFWQTALEFLKFVRTKSIFKILCCAFA